MLDRRVRTDAAHEHRILAGRRQRVRHSLDHHARRGAQQGRGVGHRQRALELGVDRQRVAGEDRHAHAGAADRQAGELEDLAALVAQLQFFLGIAVLTQHIVQRHDVVGQRHGPLARFRQRGRVRRHGEAIKVALGAAAQLLGQHLDAFDPAARGGLVGADGQALQAGLLMQRLQHRHGGHGGAVGVGDDALRDVVQRVRIDLGHHQRDVRVRAPGRAVVDHHGAGRGGFGGQLARGVAAGREEHDVQAGEVGLRGVLDDDLGSLEVDLGSGRAGGGEQAQARQREVPLGQQLAHHAADKAGGADDADAGGIGSGKLEAHGSTSPGVCGARGALRSQVESRPAPFGGAGSRMPL